MHPSRPLIERLSGWPLVGWCALVLVMLMGAPLAWYGGGEAGIRSVVRGSAQTSLILFTSAFVASAAYRVRPGPLTRWMLSNRRYLGVSFAVSHFLHLLALVALAHVSTELTATLTATTLVGGGLAYVFIAAMVATSFDRSAAWLGPVAGRRLHTTGMYYIWVIFFVSYLPRSLMQPAYGPFAIILIGAIGLRIYVVLMREERCTTETSGHGEEGA